MSLQDMVDERLLREFVVCAVVRAHPHHWGVSIEDARADLAEVREEVLRRMATKVSE
jgi:hypothetical protein